MALGLQLLAVAACGVHWSLGDASGECELTPTQNCKLKIGIVGGGSSLWTLIHNISVSAGGTRRIVAGAMNTKPEKALETAAKFGIQGYKTWRGMLEAWRRGDQDLDYVLIVTRNKDHYEPTKAFVEAGVPVFCEKPLSMTVEEAEDIQRIVQAKNVPFMMGHTFMGHPMLMLARELVRTGHIGEVRKVESWYNQDWAAENPAYSWRFDPDLAGLAGSAADVGMHTYAAGTWVSGRSVKRVTARLSSFTPGRELDESCSMLAELDNGATAMLVASSISVGYKNEHGLRIFGSKGSLEWVMATSKVLVVRTKNQGVQVFNMDLNHGELPSLIQSYDRDAPLVNLHTTMERLIRQKKGESNVLEPFPYPGVAEGVEAMRFLKAVAQSHKGNGAWTDVVRPAASKWR